VTRLVASSPLSSSRILVCSGTTASLVRSAECPKLWTLCEARNIVSVPRPTSGSRRVVYGQTRYEASLTRQASESRCRRCRSSGVNPARRQPTARRSSTGDHCIPRTALPAVNLVQFSRQSEHAVESCRLLTPVESRRWQRVRRKQHRQPVSGRRGATTHSDRTFPRRIHILVVICTPCPHSARI